MKFRLLAVIGMVIAFAVVGAGWKWSAHRQHHHSTHLAGWSWDGIALD